MNPADFKVAVRALAEFVCRKGDIDFRFTPSPTAIEGMEGHAQVYRNRPDSYKTEVALEHRFELSGVALLLRGRADGYDAQHAYVEEIKTTRVDPERLPDNVRYVHAAQAQLYGGLICLADESLQSLAVRVCYLQLTTGEEHLLTQQYGREELLDFLQRTIDSYVDFLQVMAKQRVLRDTSITQLQFPHAQYRAGQRELAETVYKCISQRSRLLAQAPTGLGKTLAVLFPAIKAIAAGKHEAFAFVTAKTVGARAAEEAVEQLRSRGLRHISLTFSAKERVCLSPGKACHGDDCRFARGYYDRLPQARHDALVGTDTLNHSQLVALAEKHEVCPYQLAVDLLPWADMCIADIHHFYSFYSGIAAGFSARQARWSVLMDESHNLPDRALGMFSVTISKRDLMAARRGVSGAIKRALDRCNRQFLQLAKEDWDEPEFHALQTVPESLSYSLTNFVAEAGEQQAQDSAVMQGHPDLLNFYFGAIQFLRVLQDWGDDFRLELEQKTGKSQSLVIRAQCLDPARLLAERQKIPDSVTAFTATAQPSYWLNRRIGFDESAVYRAIDSPFDTGQLRVSINSRIDIRYQQRQRSLPALVDAIANWLTVVEGNCIVYFPSYAYMAQALELIEPSLGLRVCLVQSPDMDIEAREGFVETLRAKRNVAAFCILGGLFGEGIDLPGDALGSVVIVGVGLPQFNRSTQALRDYYEQRGEPGFDYAYRYPGMLKVCQALGRVIRGPEDTGQALLIDSRYADSAYRDLLPGWWTYSQS